MRAIGDMQSVETNDLKAVDAQHVFVAARNTCEAFLTCDGDVLHHSAAIGKLCGGLVVQKPSDFIAATDGSRWPAGVAVETPSLSSPAGLPNSVSSLRYLPLPSSALFGVLVTKRVSTRFGF
jgi:hypothetical protein